MRFRKKQKKLDRSWQSPAEMEEQRCWFADEMVSTGLPGAMIMRWSFVSYPLQRFAIEQNSPCLLKCLVIIADAFQLSMNELVQAGRFGAEMEDRIEEGLDLVYATATQLGCHRYANLVILYGLRLGFTPVMVRHDAVDWGLVTDVERRAFDGKLKETEWWPR